MRSGTVDREHDGETRGKTGTSAGDPWGRSHVETAVAFVLVLSLAVLAHETITSTYYWLIDGDSVGVRALVGSIAAGTGSSIAGITISLGALVGAVAVLRSTDRPTRASLLAGGGIGITVVLLGLALAESRSHSRETRSVGWYGRSSSPSRPGSPPSSGRPRGTSWSRNSRSSRTRSPARRGWRT
jgi:hypothetical protein